MTMGTRAEVERYVTSVLGPVDHASDLTRRLGRVCRVIDGDGVPWVVKTVPTRLAFARESNAYRNWVPHFADQAPALHHAQPRLRTLILEHVPGDGGWTFDHATHEDAGRLLRRIHHAAPTRHRPGVGRAAAEKLDASLRTLPEQRLVTRGERMFLRACVRELRAVFGHLPLVPCHGDFGPHNWLRSGGPLQVIDFSLARFNAAAADFARLYVGPWWERPDLAAAFFTGYGRPITADELECVRLVLPVLAVGLIVHGRRHGDDDIERRGRHRLHSLMDGFDFTVRPHPVRRTARVVRRMAKSIV